MVKLDLKARGIIANFILRGYFIAVTGYADCFGILEPKDNNFLLFVTPTSIASEGETEIDDYW